MNRNGNETSDRVIVFDTTLRDGEQAPGGSMNLSQKMQVAKALAALGVDVMEVGFPVASPGDFQAVEAISRQVEGPVICALARAHRPDIDAVLKALAPASRRRVHVFLATSPIHREHKLRMTQAEVVRVATGAIEYARERCDDVEFSAEDAARTEPDFLVEVVERAIEAGATTINIPATTSSACTRASAPSSSARRAGWWRGRPGSTSRGTRRWSGRTPSCTNPASTSTG